MEVIRVFIVDDNEDWLDIAAWYLGQIPSVKAVGIARNGNEALAMEKSLQPDLVLMDFKMVDMSGISIVQQIKALPSHPCVVMVTVFHHRFYQAFADEIGADGVIGKDVYSEQLPLIINELFPS